MDTQYIRAFFDQRAARWDETCHHDPNRISAIAALAQVHPGDRVLDIACGTGVFIPQLLRYEPASVLGIDFSAEMIRCAKEKLSDPRVRLESVDLFDLTESGFDIATIYSAYPHFPDKEALVETLFSLLRPGGRFLIAHSESRHTINSRHHQGAQAVSVPLRPVREEAAVWESRFTLDILADTESFYLISGTRKDG